MSRKMADTLSYPPRMRADRAAAYLDIATSTFLKLVEEGRLPPGKKLTAGITFWDRVTLDNFIERYEGEQNRINPWDKFLESEQKK
jgi:predicted DNA-binding transcriptional regulator AlpA